jgi:hypothetical protein
MEGLILQDFSGNLRDARDRGTEGVSQKILKHRCEKFGNVRDAHPLNGYNNNKYKLFNGGFNNG